MREILRLALLVTALDGCTHIQAPAERYWWCCLDRPSSCAPWRGCFGVIRDDDRPVATPPHYVCGPVSRELLDRLETTREE